MIRFAALFGLAFGFGAIGAEAPLHASAPAPQGTPPPLNVWYLGHCGYAVKVGDKLLVFDYLPERGTPALDPAGGGLDDGVIEAADLEGLKTYVFVTHSHNDHWDPAVLAWGEKGADVTYFFGWQAGDDPRHHYMVGPRATAEIDGMRIYTINSHHSGAPEVAYLVSVDGRWIYHNGDYQQDYIPDFDYLATLTSHVDVAFTAGVYDPQWQYTLQAHALMERFHPGALFPMHYGGTEKEMEPFARVMAERGYDTHIPLPKRRGDRWMIGG